MVWFWFWFLVGGVFHCIYVAVRRLTGITSVLPLWLEAWVKYLYLQNHLTGRPWRILLGEEVREFFPVFPVTVKGKDPREAFLEFLTATF